jgi:hypothetical protein
MDFFEVLKVRLSGEQVVVPPDKYLPSAKFPNRAETLLRERGVPHNIHKVPLTDSGVPSIHEELSMVGFTIEL